MLPPIFLYYSFYTCSRLQNNLNKCRGSKRVQTQFSSNWRLYNAQAHMHVILCKTFTSDWLYSKLTCGIIWFVETYLNMHLSIVWASIQRKNIFKPFSTVGNCFNCPWVLSEFRVDNCEKIALLCVFNYHYK